MPATVDPSDTARLDLAEATPEDELPATGDTADFGPGFVSEALEFRTSELRIRKFAEAIIRFYRARTILGRGTGDELSGLAWSYLEQLEPDQLPAVARPAFFDLAYFMRLQSSETGIDQAGFRRRVLDVAVILDGFLDDIFTRAAD